MSIRPTLEIDHLNGCARCHGDGHGNLTFTQLTHPVDVGDGAPLTHWALCPATLEPILMRYQVMEREVTTTVRERVVEED